MWDLMEQKIQSTNIFQEEKPWLVLGECCLYSHLLIGIEQYNSPLLIHQVLEAARAEVLTITLGAEGSHESLSFLKLAEVVPIQMNVAVLHQDETGMRVKKEGW
jgi:thiazole synthase ThiGH ThiG subunit